MKTRLFHMILVALLSTFLSTTVAGELPSRYQKWLDEEVAYIIASSERKEFLDLESDIQRDAFVERFWGLRDPDPSTELNEYRAEHLARIEYANQHFHSGRPGWKTERGRIYIMHGPPDSINYGFGGNQIQVRIPNATQVLTGGAGDGRSFYPVEFTSPEWESWVYRRLPYSTSVLGYFQVLFSRADPNQLYFVKQTIDRLGLGRSLSYEERFARDTAIMQFQQSQSNHSDFKVLYAGDYKFQGIDDFWQGIFSPGTGPTFQMADLQRGLKDLDRAPGEVLLEKMNSEKRLRELVDSRVFFEEFSPTLAHSFVRSESGSTLVSIALGIEGSYSGDQLTLLMELLRPNGSRAAYLVESLDLPNGPDGEHWVYQNRLAVLSGRHTLRVYGLLDRRKALALLEREIEVPDYSGEGPILSDVLFFDRIVPRRRLEDLKEGPPSEGVLLPGSRTIQSRSHTWIPALDRQFRRGEALIAVLEVYNPGLQDGSKGPLLELQCRLWSGGKLMATAPVRNLDYLTEDEHGGRKTDKTSYGLSLPLRGLQIGHYELEFEVSDLILDRRLSRRAQFWVR